MPEPGRPNRGNINSQLLGLGVVTFALGILLALVIENGLLRYVASLTAVAIGLSLFRRALRAE